MNTFHLNVTCCQNLKGFVKYKISEHTNVFMYFISLKQLLQLCTYWSSNIYIHFFLSSWAIYILLITQQLHVVKTRIHHIEVMHMLIIRNIKSICNNKLLRAEPYTYHLWNWLQHLFIAAKQARWQNNKDNHKIIYR